MMRVNVIMNLYLILFKLMQFFYAILSIVVLNNIVYSVCTVFTYDWIVLFIEAQRHKHAFLVYIWIIGNSFMVQSCHYDQM